MAEDNFAQEYFIGRLKEQGLYIGEDLSALSIADSVLRSVKEETVRQFHILPIAHENGLLHIVTDNEQTYKQRSLLEKKLQRPFRLLLAESENLKRALFTFYGIKSYRQMVGMTMDVASEDLTPIQTSVNNMLQDAAQAHASDIHILPRPDFIQVTFHIDGHLYDVSDKYRFPVSQGTSLINIVKQRDTSGKVDITVHNLPNEGSFAITSGGIPINVRMETLPLGAENELEKINLRLLPQPVSSGDHGHKRLEDIGYEAEDLMLIKDVLYKNATGLFINSGPTGAGKTTSLYAQIHFLLDSIDEPLTVITIDDPIEIRDYDFCQVQVRSANSEELSLTPAKILKASLRSDPDIILYNEIRDANAATVAMQASSTGHRVFSTVHAADCVRTISRLLDFDISKTTLLAELKLIVSQRLLAKLCPHCSQPHTLTEQEKRVLSEEDLTMCIMHAADLRERGTKEARETCPHCQHGFIGRTAIAEFVPFTMKLRDTLLGRHSFSQIHAALKAEGYRSMWEKGIDMVANGLIELDELIHVVGKEE